VCLSVCLSVCREDISGTTRAIFTKLFVHVAYVRGAVFLRYVDDDDRPHRLSAGRDDGSAQRDCLVDVVVVVVVVVVVECIYEPYVFSHSAATS